MAFLLRLPWELLTIIVGQLNLLDVFRLCSTCRALRQTFRPDKLVWLVDNYNTDVTEWTAAIVEMDRIMRCHAMLKLFQKRGRKTAVHLLAEHGASFGMIPHGEAFREVLFERGHEAFNFMRDNGGSLHQTPGGINQLLEDTMHLSLKWEMKAGLCRAYGADLQLVPSGLEPLIDELLDTDEEGVEKVHYLLELGRPLRYCPPGLSRHLTDTYTRDGLCHEIDYLIRLAPNGFDILLEHCFSVYGIGPRVDEVLQLAVRWDLIAPDGDWKSLNCAAKSGDVEKVRYLLGQINLEKNNSVYGTALHAAVKSGRVEMVRILLDHAADCKDATDSDGYVPIAHACMDGHVSMIECLLEKGASISATTAAGQTPLGLAVLYHHPKAVRTLLDWGADVNAADKEGNTALTLAARLNSSAAISCLLRQESESC